MKIHIVQKGETLWNIAQKYGVNFDELKKLNAQLSNPEMIMPGMKIKVPGHSGGGVKEQPIHHHSPVKKEMPKAEHPFLPKKEAPMPVAKPPKEKPKKEMPQQIYQPVMPQPQTLPEIDINNYYMMNMQQMQAQQMPQPAPPKEKPIHHHEEESISPEMPIQQPMYHYPMPTPCFDPCYNPCFDPCYPQQQPQPYPGYMMAQMQPMQPMPQVQGAMSQMPMNPYQPMPDYNGVMPGYWGMDESPDDHVEMQHHHYGGLPNQMESSSDCHQQMGIMPAMNQPYPYPAMPMAGFQQPMMHHAPPGDCGCENQSQQYPHQVYGIQGQSFPMQHQGYMNPGYPPMGTAMPPSYAMPIRNDNEERNE